MNSLPSSSIMLRVLPRSTLWPVAADIPPLAVTLHSRPRMLGSLTISIASSTRASLAAASASPLMVVIGLFSLAAGWVLSCFPPLSPLQLAGGRGRGPLFGACCAGLVAVPIVGGSSDAPASAARAVDLLEYQGQGAQAVVFLRLPFPAPRRTGRSRSRPALRKSPLDVLSACVSPAGRPHSALLSAGASRVVRDPRCAFAYPRNSGFSALG